MTAIKPPNPGGLGEYKTLSALSRWKIFDNLRRSIVAPGTVALLATAWLAIPETSWIVALAATLLLLVPAAFNAGICLMRKAQTVPLRLHLYTVAADFGWSLVQSCITLATRACAYWM